LVTHYPPGAGIGWHRDAPAFGRVVGISLGEPCRFKLRRGKSGAYEVLQVELAPRSAYLLRGTARWNWQHSIPAVKLDRYSVTFRSLRATQ
jgi:alkylated DNA repair dioxygenase AlkB